MLCPSDNNPKCLWEINVQKDNYCPGCGLKLVDIEASIFNNSTLRLPKNNVTIITLENKGKIDIEDIYLESNDMIEEVENPLVINRNEKTKLVIKPNSASAIGSKGKLILKSNSDRILLNYDFVIIESAKIEISVDDGFNKDGCWYIDSNEKEIHFLIHSTEDIVLPEKPQVSAPHNNILLLNYEDNKLKLNSMNYEAFSVIGLDNIKEETFEIKIQVNPTGYNKDIKEFDFNIKKYDFPRLYEFTYERKHNCKIPDRRFTEGRLQLIKGSTINKNLTISIANKSANKSFLIDNILVKDTIKRVVNDSKTFQIESNKWLQCTNKDEFTGKSIDESLKADGKIRIAFNIITEKIPNSLFIDEAGKEIKKPILFENEIILNYHDIFTNKTLFTPILITFEIFYPQETNITIDFGTTNSCLAYNKINESGNEAIGLVELDLNKHETQLPTVIRFLKLRDKDNTTSKLFQEKISVLVSDYELLTVAEGVEANTINATAIGFKSQLKNRSLNEQGIVFSDNDGRFKNYSPIELTALYLKSTILNFESNYPYKAKKIHVTFPAVFTQYEKNNLLKAIELCGYSSENVVLEVTEPIALAMDFIFKLEIEEGEKKLIGVFDCGGGTTDITIAEFSKIDGAQNIKFLASDGDDILGGNYLTYLIAKKVYEHIQEKNKDQEIPFPENFIQLTEITNFEEKRNFNAFWSYAEKLKINNRIEKFITQIYTKDGKVVQNRDIKLNIEEVYSSTIAEPIKETLNKINILLLQLYEKGDVFNSFIDNNKTNIIWIVGLKYIVFDNNREMHTEFINSFDLDKISESYMNIRSFDTNLDLKPMYHILGIKFEANNSEYYTFSDLNKIKDYKIKFPLKLDYLLLGGNSSRLEYLRKLAKDVVWCHSKPEFDPNTAKTGVVKGAADYLYYTRMERPFQIQGTKMISYAIGYLLFGEFKILYNHWETEPFEEKKSEIFSITEERDLLIRIFENRDITKAKPEMIPHKPKKQPIIGSLNLPDTCIGKRVYFSFLFEPDKSEFFFKVYEFETDICLSEKQRMAYH